MNIYVGNLAFQITENELLETFAVYGEVTRVAIIKDKRNGRSRGFGFVEMDRTQGGEMAIAELDGALCGDRALRVKEARTRAESNGKPRSKTNQG